MFDLVYNQPLVVTTPSSQPTSSQVHAARGRHCSRIGLLWDGLAGARSIGLENGKRDRVRAEETWESFMGLEEESRGSRVLGIQGIRILGEAVTSVVL